MKKSSDRYDPLALITIVAPSKKLAKRLERLVNDALDMEGVDGAVVGVVAHDCRGMCAKNAKLPRTPSTEKP